MVVNMIQFAVICALIAGASAVPGYASSQYSSAGTSSGGVYNQVNDDVYADKYPYAQTGFGGGGASAGSGVFIPGFVPFQQVPVFPNSFDFNQFFQSLQANFANLYQQQLAHQNALFNTFRQQQEAFAANAAGAAGAGAAAGTAPGGGVHVGGGGADIGGGGYAAASAAYGPGGFQQTAHINPPSPDSPNVNTRFGGEGIPPSGSGFVGVSSFSSSSNVNGQTHREAVTSVNDNGKVTTYRVRS